MYTQVNSKANSTVYLMIYTKVTVRFSYLLTLSTARGISSVIWPSMTHNIAKEEKENDLMF